MRKNESQNENENEREDESENEKVPAESSARPSPSVVLIDAERYESKGRHLVESSALKSLEFHRNLPAHEAENFARQKAKAMTAFRSK